MVGNDAGPADELAAPTQIASPGLSHCSEEVAMVVTLWIAGS